MIGQDAEKRPPNPDALWRAEYRREREAERVAAEQPDLFGGDPVQLFRPNAKPKPVVDRKRYSKRRDYLTPAEQAAMLATAANWLRVRQRVRIDPDAPHEFAAREGVVWRLCSPVRRSGLCLSRPRGERAEREGCVRRGARRRADRRVSSRDRATLVDHSWERLWRPSCRSASTRCSPGQGGGSISGTPRGRTPLASKFLTPAKLGIKMLAGSTPIAAVRISHSRR